MKYFTELLRSGLAAFLSIVALASAAAQALPERPSLPVKLFASAYGHNVNGEPGELWLGGSGFVAVDPVSGAGTSFDIDAYQWAGAYAWYSTASATAQFEPGKIYSISVYGLRNTNYRLFVNPPAGHRVEINGVVRNVHEIAGGNAIYQSHIYQVRIVPSLDDYFGRAGAASSLSADHVRWQVSLGALRNGDSARALALIDAGTAGSWSSIFTPAGIQYQEPSTEVAVYREANAVRQVLANEAAVDVYTLSPTSYELRFYHSDQVNGTTWPRTFTGDPFVTYRIEQGTTATTLKISRLTRNLTSGAVAQTDVTTLARSGSWPDYTWTRRDWHTDGQTGQREEVHQPLSGNTTQARSETIEVRYSGGAVASRVTRNYALKPWGEVVSSETIGTTSPVTNTYDYYTDSNHPGSYGNLKSRVTSGGGWEAYEYYDATPGGTDTGRVKRSFRPYLNEPATPGVDAGQLGEITYYEYGLDAFGVKTRPTLVRTTIASSAATLVAAESTTTYSEAAFTQNSISFNLVTATRTDSTDAGGGTLVSVTKFYREDTSDAFFRNRTHSAQQPDGVKVSYAYQRGEWNGTAFTKASNNGLGSGSASRIAMIVGTTGAGTACTDYDGYDIDDLNLVNGKSTLEVTIRNQRAQVVRTELHVWNSGWNLVKSISHSYDNAGLLLATASSDNTSWSASYVGARRQTEQDHTGTILSYSYDAAGRVETVTKASGPATTYAYDAANRILSENLTASGTGENIYSSRAYDDAGRLSSDTPAGLGATSYTYNPSTRAVTATLPEDSATRTETYHLDGRLQKVEGSAVVPAFYTYGWELDGRQWVQTFTGTASSPRWQKSWTDRVDRPRRIERPGFSITSQGNSYEEHLYEAATGRLTRTNRNGYAPTRYGYDELGRPNRTGLDVGADGLANNSSDRISDTDQSFEQLEGAWWLKTVAKTYPDGTATPIVVSTTRVRLTDFGTGKVEEVRTADAEGNTVTRTVVCNAPTKTTTVTTARSGFSTNQVETVVNGLLTSTTTHTGLTYTTQHDPLGRVWKSYDPRNKLTTTTYKYGSALVQSVKDHLDNESQTFYDARGRVIRTQDAAGKITRFSYNQRGQLLRQWGSAAYPVEHAYDSTYGDRTGLSTFRSAPAADSVSWPSVGTADTTTFAFDPATGLLWKRTDAAGKYVEYSYNERGQVHQRFWARTYASNRVTSTYAYDPDTGELTGITYNDTTPSVGYTYTRLGQPKTATDYTGTRTFNYDSTKPWRQTSTTLPAFYGSRTFSLLYEESGVVGRDRGFQLGSGVGSAADLETAYTFTAGGRLETLASKRAANSVSRTFRYGYKANTGLVESLTIDGSHPFSLTRSYHPDLDLVMAVDTKWSGVSRARYDYTYNALYQRATAKQSGDIFADYGDSTYYRYTYNDRGELTDAPAYLGSDVSSTAQPLPGRQHAYSYDSIGNRKWANRTGNAALKESFFANDTGTTEGANALNQYRSSENDSVPVQGTVDASSTTVAVAGATTTGRQGRFFAAEVAVGNATAPWSGSVVAYAAKVGGGSGGTDLVRSSSTDTRLAKALQVLAYDDDGNLLSDGLWDYQWDAENRLVRMAATALAVTAGYPNKVMEFRYDYQGRRVMKRDANVAGSERRHLLYGWNVVAEFAWNASTSTLSLSRSFTWGLDLVGSLSASGGVGALLQIRDESQNKTLLPTYDGNGNVASLLNADTGALEAAYEYDPFGRLLRAEGTYAKENTFRFSTKWHDDETGLVYYGLRYYSSSLGRFINRDPIGEQGGMNLYGFVGNDAINGWDYLGMAIWGGNPHVTLDGSPSTAEGPSVPSITPYDFQPGLPLPGSNPSDPTDGARASPFPLPGVRQWGDSSATKQSEVDGEVGMSVVLPAINFYYLRSSGALTSWNMGSSGIGFRNGSGLGYIRSIRSSSPLHAPNSADFYAQLDAQANDMSQMLAQTGARMPTPRPPRYVRIDNGGILSGARPTSGGPGPLPADLTITPVSGSTVRNPIPSELARVIPGTGPFPTLGAPGSRDVFVTNPRDIAGLTPAQIAQRLGIPPAPTYTVIRFPTPSSGTASPILRTNPQFVGQGRTSGGAVEFVIPNVTVPANSTITIVRTPSGTGSSSSGPGKP